jgi:hypothetical protein
LLLLLLLFLLLLLLLLLVILLCRGCALSKDNYNYSHYIIRDLCERPSVQMLSPHKEWQVALQRAQAIRPLTASSREIAQMEAGQVVAEDSEEEGEVQAGAAAEEEATPT